LTFRADHRRVTEGLQPGQVRAPHASPGGSRAIRIALYAAGILGLALATYLIADFGAAQILSAMLTIGWGLAAVTAFHLLPMLMANLSWRALLPRHGRPGAGALLWIRWIRESVNTLLPVGQVGGDLVCARLVHRRGVPATSALASMVVDLSVSVLTQLVFVALGLALLLMRSLDPTVLVVAWGVAAGMGILLALMAVFLLAQRAGMFALVMRIGGALLRGDAALRLGAKAAEIDRAIRALYRDKRAFWTAMAWRLADWIVGAGEVWLIMYFLGKPVGVAEALILESLGTGVRSAAFLVPGAVGILEASYIVFGSLFGISAADSLALALAKRVRELLIGLPGLVAWQVAESRRLIGRRRAAHKG
jgi:putative membrane protein